MKRPDARALLALSLSFLFACADEAPGVVPPRAVRVAPVRVERGSGQARYSGALGPRRQVDLAFRVPGRVGRLKQVVDGGRPRPLQEGDVVRAGEVLAALDLDDLRRQAAAAAAGVSAARAQLEAASLGLAQAEREVARARTLARSGDVAQSDLDRAEAGLDAARAGRDAAAGALRGRVEQHLLARNTLADATLRAPFDGVVARVAVDEAEAVGPNVPVLSVMDVSQLTLAFGLPDSRLDAVAPGQKLPVSIEARPGRVREAVVTRIAPTADPVLRTYAVEVTLAEVEGLQPGMTGTVRLTRSTGEATAVPLSALVRGQGADELAVFTLGADGRTVKRHPVEVTDLLENDALLRVGPAAGERVVADGAAFLREGDVVGVVP